MPTSIMSTGEDRGANTVSVEGRTPFMERIPKNVYSVGCVSVFVKKSW